MATTDPSPLRFSDARAHAQALANAQTVHKRQCLLLCAFVDNTLTTQDHFAVAPEFGQQWDDTLTNIRDRLADWAKLGPVQSYLRSDAIQAGVDQLAEELKWCGLRPEDLQWAEKRRLDAESLHGLLRTIVSDPALLEQVFKQPPEAISLFIRRCQYELTDGTVPDSARPNLEAALMQLYKSQSAYILTPNLSSQVVNIDRSPLNIRALYRSFAGSWLGKEDVTIRSLRLVQIDLQGVKRFREDVSRYYLVRHRNIAQIYGYTFSQELGCCLISPSLSDLDSLSYLEQHDEANVIPWLHDISSALLYLHTLPQPILCGCLQAETIFIRANGTAYISDFGIFQLSRKPWEAVERLLRWCAPEVIRTARRRERGEDVSPICTKQSDIYSFSMAMFGKEPVELFTGEIPVHHIENGTSLEPEILHGNRPYISGDLKTRAKLRGFDDDVQQLMHNCWQAEAKKRPKTREIVDLLAEYTESASRLRVRRSELSTGSIMTNRSSRSSSSAGSSAIHPLTPPSSSSYLPSSSPVSVISGEADTPGATGQTGFFETARSYSEPSQEGAASIGREHKTMEMLSKLSFSPVPVRDQVNPSEQTLRGTELRSTFSSSSEESHLGQREDSAYERMPQLRTASLRSPKRRGSGDPFAIVVTRMREDGQINPQWVGVANMERIRGFSRRSSLLQQATAVERLIQEELKFLADKTDEQFTRSLEDTPGILGDRLEKFLSSIFDEITALRLVNYQFSNALQASSDVANIGFTPFAVLCKEAALRFGVVYPEYVSHLPDIKNTIKKEINTNKRFAAFMNEQSRGKTRDELLDDFICAPIKHLETHHKALQLILQGMDKGDPDISKLQDAHQEMLKTWNVILLASWQQTTDKKDWKDFVSADIVRAAPKAAVNRQILIFELIAEERDYLVKMKLIQTMFEKIALELENRRRKDDAAIIRALIASFNEFIRFHGRLSENLSTLQRNFHPWIESFVLRCGINSLPWHALYDHNFASAYVKLAELVQDGNNTRQSIFARVLQEVMPNEKEDFMEVLRTPSLHLRVFVDRLQKTSALLPTEDEDRQVITEILPRLQDVSRQVEVKTSGKDDARLSSLSSALDFCSFPGVDVHDIDISAKSRNLIYYGKLRVGVASSTAKTMTLQERVAFLFDNYLLLTKKDDSLEFPSFVVSDKPIALDIVSLSRNSIFPQISSEEVHPCVLVTCANEDPMYLFADSEASSRTWYEKLENTVKEREKAKAQVITREVVERFSHLPNCSADIIYSGQTITITARDAPQPGIWVRIGFEIRLAHPLADITKLSVLDDVGLLLVLAGQCLCWIRLDDLLGTGRTLQKSIDSDMSVNWFRTGIVRDRLFLVVSAGKKRSTKSFLRFYEVGKGSSRSLSSLRSKSPFNLLTDVELTSAVKDIYFLRNSFILVTDTFQPVTYNNPAQLKESITSGKLPSLPLRDDPMTDLVERCRFSSPIGIHRVEKGFVLCYKELAVYINENGRLSNRVINWESSDVQTVLFRPPHMLTFGSSIVEVRQIATGVLEQLVPLPGQVRVAWESLQKDDNPGTKLGIHLLVSEGQNRQTSTSWYSLDEQHPFTLLRLLRP